MIPITVYLQTPDGPQPYQRLFQQQFYEIPTLGSTVRVYVADREDAYVVREVYHDFRSGPQGPSPLPISIVVTLPEDDAQPEANGHAHSDIGGSWGTEFQNTVSDVDSPRL